MNSERFLTRELSFYTIQTMRGSKKKAEADYGFDWAKALGKVISEEDLFKQVQGAMGSVAFDVLQDVDFPCLALYRPIDSTFILTRREGATTVENLDERRGFQLMNASAYFFIPERPGLVCMLQGSQSVAAPSITSLKEFAKALVPQTAPSRWTTTPVRRAAQVGELERAVDISQLRTKARGHEGDLIDDLPVSRPWRGFGSLGNDVARAVGGEVEVTINVKFPRNWGNSRQRQSLRDIVLREERSGVSNLTETKVRARVRNEGGVSEETLTLVEHDLATKIHVEVREDEPIGFSALVREAAADLRKNGHQYAAIAAGGSDGVDEEQAL